MNRLRVPRYLAMHKAVLAFDLLAENYGLPDPKPLTGRENYLLTLIKVIVAQNTSRRNQRKALANLARRFPDPALIAEANVADIVDAIFVAGLANTKAPRIKALVNAVLEATGGSSDLTFLNTFSTEEALGFLSSLPGIGPMSAALVLLFSMGRPVLPVNTGLHRVALRVGMIPPRSTPERTQWLLQAQIPPKSYCGFHLNMVSLARNTCRIARPECDDCCLTPICDFAYGRVNDE